MEKENILTRIAQCERKTASGMVWSNQRQLEELIKPYADALGREPLDREIRIALVCTMLIHGLPTVTARNAVPCRFRVGNDITPEEIWTIFAGNLKKPFPEIFRTFCDELICTMRSHEHAQRLWAHSKPEMMVGLSREISRDIVPVEPSKEFMTLMAQPESIANLHLLTCGMNPINSSEAELDLRLRTMTFIQVVEAHITGNPKNKLSGGNVRMLAFDMHFYFKEKHD